MHEHETRHLDSWRTLLREIGPRFARDAFGPALAFYLGWKTIGLVAGIVAATVTAVTLWWLSYRRGTRGVLPRLALAIVLVQAVVGLISGDATLYLAQPAIVGLLVGSAFLVSAFVGRPIAGLVAADLLALPAEVEESPDYRSAFRVVTLVWAAYLLARASIRLVVVLTTSVEIFLAVTAVTGAPAMAVLSAWSGAYALRSLRRSDAARAGAEQARRLGDAADTVDD